MFLKVSSELSGIHGFQFGKINVCYIFIDIIWYYRSSISNGNNNHTDSSNNTRYDHFAL